MKKLLRILRKFFTRYDERAAPVRIQLRVGGQIIFDASTEHIEHLTAFQGATENVIYDPDNDVVFAIIPSENGGAA